MALPLVSDMTLVRLLGTGESPSLLGHMQIIITNSQGFGVGGPKSNES